jgi:hypothetical protein
LVGGESDSVEFRQGITDCFVATHPYIVNQEIDGGSQGGLKDVIKATTTEVIALLGGHGRPLLAPKDCTHT